MQSSGIVKLATAPRTCDLRIAGPRAGLRRPRVVAVASRLQLTFVGDGTTDHLELESDYEVEPAQTLELGQGVFEVGRVPPADLILSVPTVSSRHALLRIDDLEVTLTDLNSTNGTYVNDEEVKPMEQVKLKPNSEVYFGDQHLAKYKLVVVEDESSAAS